MIAFLILLLTLPSGKNTEFVTRNDSLTSSPVITQLNTQTGYLNSENPEFADYDQMKSKSEGNLHRFEFSTPLMGSTFRILLYAHTEQLAKQAADSAFKKAEYLNSIFSNYDPESELNRLSASSKNNSVPVSEPLFEVIASALSISKKSEGAFDITAGPYTKIWRDVISGMRPDIPTSKELERHDDIVGYHHVAINRKTQSVKLKRPNMKLDLGGIAKGYTADRMAQVLQDFGIHRYLVDAGGDMVLGVSPPESKGWQVARLIPGHDDTVYCTLKLSQIAITTSGDRYQYIENEGMRYSHIVDPRTGMGLTRRSTVTVTGPRGVFVDAWATTLNVLSNDDGLELIENSENFEAQIFVIEGNEISIYQTEGFRRLLNE